MIIDYIPLNNLFNCPCFWVQLTRWYGPLKSYEYKDVNNKMYYAQIFGKTDKVEKQSYLFKDGEEVLELTFEIDLANTPLELQKKIRKDFIELVESVKVNKI